MQPRSPAPGRQLFGTELTEILNHRHELFILAHQLNWARIEQELSACFAQDIGRPGVSIRLMTGLLYLKHAFNESDESVVARWIENPYWQYFCGQEYMEHACPIDPSSLTRFRQRVGAERLEWLLQLTLEAATKLGALTASDLETVNVDTTVQEKAITYPTDAKLYHKMRIALVRCAGELAIPLNQTYVRVGKRVLCQQARFAHARKYQQANKMTRRLKTMLGRVLRDVLRKTPRIAGEIADERLRELCQLAERLLAQTRTSKHKLYSVHAPEVECISKGKAHKKYEFGCKVSLTTTSKTNWIIGARACHGNPYDGHTLRGSVEQVQRITGVEPKQVNVDQGFKGHDYVGDAQVNIIGVIAKTLSRAVRRMFKRRAAIEPVIGHAKADNRLCRNPLWGKEGDKINVLLAAAGFNLRKLLRWIAQHGFFVTWRKLETLLCGWLWLWANAGRMKSQHALN
jgi:transposase, IS5 family